MHTTATQRQGRGDLIDISDLRSPVLTELQKQAMAAAAVQPAILDEAAVLAQARQATGLSDFGDEGFRERLRLWLKAARDDVELTPLGQAAVFHVAVRYTTQRLRIEDLVKCYPEILEIEIKRPVVIAGLPRSGTTYLQSFLAADPRLRSLPYWEAIRPVPAPGEQVVRGCEDPRRTKAAAEWEQQDALLPYVKSIHEFSPDHISEDIEFQCLEFCSYYLDWMGNMPGWRDYYFATDQTPGYRYLKKCLQVLNFLTGSKRWLLKCPQHMEQLVPLLTVFPDATVAITHRDPVASIQSAMTAICYTARVNRTSVRPDVVADYWIDRYERLLRACVRDRDKLDEAHTVDLYFHELMRDPFGALAQIYSKAGLVLTEPVRARLQTFMEANPRGKHGQIVYNLQRDFDLTAEDIRKRFRFYFERFPVRAEVK